ncbi:hypothetical protein BH11PLA1_BH11PLA1_09930 [soil metagenome]
MPARLAAISLGSNLGDRAAILTAAAELLAQIPATRLLKLSTVIETAPIGVAPGVDPGPPYLNAAALLSTMLEPDDLLRHLQTVEHTLGRDRTLHSHGSARPIDLDLILLGDLIVASPALKLPHPALAARLFVLEPLAEIAPDLIVPNLNATVGQLCANLKRALVHSTSSPFPRSLFSAFSAPSALSAFSPLLCLLLISSVSAAPLTLDPVTALREIRAVYTAAPVAENITLTLRISERTTRQDRITFALDPHAPADPHDDTIALLLGPLRVHAAGGVLTVTQTNFDETYFEAPYREPLTVEQLTSILPPLPLPQLALLRADADTTILDLAATAPSVNFSAAVTDPAADRPEIALTGASPRGSVTLTVDVRSGRLKHIVLGNPAAIGSLAFAFEAIKPDPALFIRPDISKRRRVATPALLALPPQLDVNTRFPKIPSLLASLPTAESKPLVLILLNPRASASVSVAAAENELLLRILRLAGQSPQPIASVPAESLFTIRYLARGPANSTSASPPAPADSAALVISRYPALASHTSEVVTPNDAESRTLFPSAAAPIRLAALDAAGTLRAILDLSPTTTDAEISAALATISSAPASPAKPAAPDGHLRPSTPP